MFTIDSFQAKKSADSWFENEFSGLDLPSVVGNGKKRKQKSKEAATSRSGGDLPLAQAYEPKTEADLVVHKKKVTEVRQFLETAFSSPKTGFSPILFLTGPSGSGKTTVVKVLCSLLSCAISEWINPSYDAASDTTGVRATFKEFLFRSGRYPQLDFGSFTPRRIVMVEDIPNVFLMPSYAASFLDIIEQYRCSGGVPLIIILLESAEYNRLLPRRAIDAGLVAHISLNPVATSFIVKCLSKVAAAECTRLRQPVSPAAELESIANSCGGDVRSALNALAFRMLRTTRQRGSDADPNPSLATARDASMDLFHALGKVLMGKPSVTDSGGKPVFMPLEYVQDIAAASGVSQERFALFLHENHPEFFTDLEDLETAAERFSEADVLSSYWQGGNVLSEYAAAVVCRGLACANRSPAASRWRPLHRPAYTEVMTQADSLWSTVAAAFFDPSGTEPMLPVVVTHSTRDLKLDILPALARLRPRVMSAVQALNIMPLTRWRPCWPGRRTSLTAAAGDDDEDEPSSHPYAGAAGREAPPLAPSAAAVGSTDTPVPMVEDVDMFDSD